MATYTSQTMTTSNDKVNYRIVVTTTSQSIENNTTTMNVKVQAWRNNAGYTTSGSGTCYCRIQGTLYSNAVYDSQKITQNSYTVLFTKNITIPHNADGSCTLKLSAYIDHYAFSTNEQYYNVALPTIPRASNPTLSKTTFDIGEEITITTNRVSNNFTHDILLLLANGSYSTIASGVTDNYVWQTGDLLYAQCPNSPSFSSKILVRTYNSGTKIGEKPVDFKANVTDSNPTCESISYTQINPTVAQLTGNDTDIILTKSEIKVTFTGATAKNYASIKKYHIQIDNTIFTSESNEFTVTDIPSAEKIYGWVEDSRQFDSFDDKKETTLGTCYQYSQPIINNIKLNRESDVYANTYLSFSAEVAEIIAVNSAYSIYWRSKPSDTTIFGDDAYIVHNDSSLTNYTYDSLLGEFSIDKNFNFEIIIEDSFGSYTYTAFLRTSRPELSIRNNMVGINCVPIADNGTLQINGTNILDLIYPLGAIYMSVNATSPETLFGGRWESISDTFLLCAGTTYAAGTTGGEEKVALKISELPKHRHIGGLASSQGSNYGETLNSRTMTTTQSTDGAVYLHTYTTYVGSDESHNNMPPYLAVYCWKRVE
ncbi:MAG: hypothetical protein IJF35_01770 [Clostridia bacterium]|nr:hypothetical protein [Clostridia bacterium]